MHSNNGHNNGGSGNGPDNEGNDTSHAENIIMMPDPAARAQRAAQQTGVPPTAQQPMINLPPMTKFLTLALLAIQAVMVFALDPRQRYAAIEAFGFIPAYYSGDIPFAFGAVAGPATYAFLHGGWTHVLMNVVMLMAFGTGLERWMGWRRMAVLMAACSIAAAIAHLAFHIGSQNPVIGASGAISGMFAAAIVMLQKSGQMGAGGRFGLWPLVILWIALSVLFGSMGGPGGEDIAWVAHIGGFLAGLLLIHPVMRLPR